MAVFLVVPFQNQSQLLICKRSSLRLGHSGHWADTKLRRPNWCRFQGTTFWGCVERSSKGNHPFWGFPLFDANPHILKATKMAANGLCFAPM